MSVRVRLFAALREAAGASEETVDAGPLQDLLAGLGQRHGELFRRRLSVATVLVDGSAVARDAAIEVHDGAEVVLLPPVSGGTGPAAVVAWRPAGGGTAPPYTCP